MFYNFAFKYDLPGDEKAIIILSQNLGPIPETAVLYSDEYKIRAEHHPNVGNNIIDGNSFIDMPGGEVQVEYSSPNSRFAENTEGIWPYSKGKDGVKISNPRTPALMNRAGFALSLYVDPAGGLCYIPVGELY